MYMVIEAFACVLKKKKKTNKHFFDIHINCALPWYILNLNNLMCLVYGYGNTSTPK